MKTSEVLKVCQKCGAACCRMGGPDFTKFEMEKVLKAGYPNFFIEINSNHYEVKSKKGICPYLAEDNSCSIHEVRLPMCKSWPVYPHYKSGEKRYFLAECPLTPLLSKQDVQNMKEQASLIQKEIVLDSFTSSKLPKQDINLIKERFDKFKRRSLR